MEGDEEMEGKWRDLSGQVRIIFFLIGVGYGNPLQYSCLGNPMDRGAWWVTAHRVAQRLQSWTLLNTHIHILANESKLGLRVCAFFMWECSATQMGHKVGRYLRSGIFQGKSTGREHMRLRGRC